MALQPLHQRRGGLLGAALLLAVLFQFLTAPVAAHMIGRGALRTGQVRLPLYEDPGVSADARDDD